MAKVKLHRITREAQLLPQRKDMFPAARWMEAKRLLAKVLRQTSKEAGRYPAKFLQERMVGADFPAVNGGYCNGLLCVANSGEHSHGGGYFTLEDAPGCTYMYAAPAGTLCIAHITDDGQTTYYRID